MLDVMKVIQCKCQNWGQVLIIALQSSIGIFINPQVLVQVLSTYVKQKYRYFVIKSKADGFNTFMCYLKCMDIGTAIDKSCV